MNNQIASIPEIARGILREYFDKLENAKSEIEQYYKSVEKVNAAFCVGGKAPLGGVVSKSHIYEQNAQAKLLSSAWQSLYTTLNLDMVFSASDKQRFERLLASPIPLNRENLNSVFGQYWDNPRYYILKGLAEVFCALDPFYKSHSNFGVGVKGLPKRVIMSGFHGAGSYGRERLLDLCQAMLQVNPSAWLGEHQSHREIDGKIVPPADFKEVINEKLWGAFGRVQEFDVHQLGLRVKTFQNGNAHVFFNDRALELVNDALHEFYGDVLPDASEEKPSKKAESKEVSKDLAFYPTPKAVIEHIFDRVSFPKEWTVLEPSCGDGAILDALRKRGNKCVGVEYDYGRAEQARAKGHSVICDNFLKFNTQESAFNFEGFDAVFMNPPFAGRHYLKHITKAIECLKEGGYLIAILPASAHYSHKQLPKGGTWYDLPIGSFKESGTNVNTGFYHWRKPL